MLRDSFISRLRFYFVSSSSCLHKEPTEISKFSETMISHIKCNSARCRGRIALRVLAVKLFLQVTFLHVLPPDSHQGSGRSPEVKTWARRC